MQIQEEEGKMNTSIHLHAHPLCSMHSQIEVPFDLLKVLHDAK